MKREENTSPGEAGPMPRVTAPRVAWPARAGARPIASPEYRYIPLRRAPAATAGRASRPRRRRLRRCCPPSRRSRPCRCTRTRPSSSETPPTEAPVTSISCHVTSRHVVSKPCHAVPRRVVLCDEQEQCHSDIKKENESRLVICGKLKTSGTQNALGLLATTGCQQ